MTRHKNGKLVETVPAIAGLIFSLAAAVQFLGADIYLGIIDYQFASAHAFVVSLAALIVVFASSKTKNWEYYESHEQVLVGVTILLMTAHEYSTTAETAVSNNDPHAGFAIFLMGLLSWGVLAR